MNYEEIQIETLEIKKEISFNDTVILTYTIHYPELSSPLCKMFLNRLNLYYKDKALSFQSYCESKLHEMAVDQYEYSIANNYPIQAYEAIENFTVTYNQNCALSLYFDQYEYTGGAHGATLRYSDTWNLQRARRISLQDLFPFDRYYKIVLLKEITELMSNETANGTGHYFDDYRDLAVKTFNTSSFYLMPDALAIYYQQYDIAPYSSGIPQLLLPYAEINAVQPSCW